MKIKGIAWATLSTGACLALLGGTGSALPTQKSGASNPGCLYGQVIDGHSGAVRCLSPEEVSPPTPYDTLAPADAGTDAARDAAPPRIQREAGIDAAGPIPLRSVTLSPSVESVTFEGGEVPRAQAALERIKKDFAKCLVELAPPKADATLELRFLVRAPGRAEGVDVVQAKGVSVELVKCVKLALSGRPVGAPTSDPVGVDVVIRFGRGEPLP